MEQPPKNLKELTKDWGRPNLWDIWPLLLMNLLIIGAYFFNKWPPVNLFLFFMAETFFIGVWNIIKMYVVWKRGGGIADKNAQMKPLGFILFIFLHYTFFGIIQFILFMAVTGMEGNSWAHVYGENANIEPFNLIQIFKGFLSTPSIRNTFLFILAFVSLHEIRQLVFYSHSLSNNIDQQGFRPYVRIIIQQFVVILGGFLVAIQAIRDLGIFFLLVAFKLLADIYYAKIDNLFVSDLQVKDYE